MQRAVNDEFIPVTKASITIGDIAVCTQNLIIPASFKMSIATGQRITKPDNEQPNRPAIAGLAWPEENVAAFFLEIVLAS